MTQTVLGTDWNPPMWNKRHHHQPSRWASFLIVFQHLLCACSVMPDSCNPMDYIACQAPLSMTFSRQEYWSELPFPSPGFLLHPETEPTSLVSPALPGGYFSICTTWEACLSKLFPLILGFPHSLSASIPCNHVITAPSPKRKLRPGEVKQFAQGQSS